MIDAIAQTSTRPLPGESTAPAAAVNAGGSAEFEDALAGAMRPPEDGGCQCDARAADAPIAARADPPAALRDSSAVALPVGLGSDVATQRADDAAHPSDDAASAAGTCGSCGLPFSLGELADAVPRPAAPDLQPDLSVPPAWATVTPARLVRSVSFET